MEMDRDLQSIQEVRNLVAQARKAADELAEFSQEELDAIVAEIAKAGAANAEKLAKMANEETGFGNWQDKILKNLLGSTIVYESVKNMKCVGLLKEDEQKGIWEIGVPMGVVAALIPSTNPTSTVLYKTIIALKAGNAIVISPHPGAKKAILETVKIIQEAARKAGAPEGAIGCITLTTVQATDALLKNPNVSVILATGGEAMVHAAYSSGNPALGVGPGNGPSFIEESADIPMAIKHIFDSKTFDNGTICASEHSIVTLHSIAAKVEAEAAAQGGYFLNEEESKKVSALLLRANGTMNPKIVGRRAVDIAAMAGVNVPAGTRVLLSRETTVSRTNPYSREKLCPVLGYYVKDNWQDACELCIAILKNEGAGHTMTIHSQNMAVIRAFAMKKPVSRLLVNTPGALGGVGASTNLAPALTLGCGAVGGSATSDNITPMNLINIRRVAFGARELEEIRGSNPVPEMAAAAQSGSVKAAVNAAIPAGVSGNDLEAITRAVLARLGR